MSVLVLSRRDITDEACHSVFALIEADPRTGVLDKRIGFQFDHYDAAKAFANAEDVGGWLPLETGKHVYFNWDVIIEHRSLCAGGQDDCGLT